MLFMMIEEGTAGIGKGRGILKLRIGTRGSRLALRQSEQVKETLERAVTDLSCELIVIHTKGDRMQHVALDQINDKGLFVKEIERQLLEGRIDLAVHSLKDMPSTLPQGLCFADCWAGEDPRDALVLREAASLQELPKGARIATGSIRRREQLLRLRPDLVCCGIRGNVESRLRKMEEERLDGVILAAAGLKRLGMEERITHLFAPDEMISACGQGLLAIECRKEDVDLLQLLNRFADSDAMLRSTCERFFLAQMGGGCHLPIGAYLQCGEEEAVFYCLYGDGQKGHLATWHKRAPKQEAFRLAKEGAEQMRRQVESWEASR